MDLVENPDLRAPAVRHPWELARRNVVADLLADALPRGGAVLDVGSGDGWLLRSLARAHPEVPFLGVDTAFTPAMIETLRAAEDLPNVTYGAELDRVAPPEPVGTVLLLDVLEHIEADGAFLRDLRCRPWLASGATLIATVPAWQWLFGTHDLHLRHLRRYTRPRLEATLAEGGWTPAESGYVFASLLPPRTLQVGWEWICPPAQPKADSELAGWSGGPRLTRWIERILYADARMCRRLARWGLPVPGLSAYAVARADARRDPATEPFAEKTPAPCVPGA